MKFRAGLPPAASAALNVHLEILQRASRTCYSPRLPLLLYFPHSLVSRRISHPLPNTSNKTHLRVLLYGAFCCILKQRSTLHGPTRAGRKYNDLLSLVHPGSQCPSDLWRIVTSGPLGVDRRFAASKLQTNVHGIAREVSNWATLATATG